MLISRCSRVLKETGIGVKTVINMAMPRNHRSRQNFSHGSRPALRVLIDMDGVLCDFEQQFLTKFKGAYPDKEFIPLEKRRTFYLSDDYGKIHDNAFELARALYEAPGFFGNMQPIEGSIEAVKEMSGLDNVEVFFCTSPVITSQYCVQDKFNWIEKHFGHDWLDRLIIAKDKTVVKGHILIDDKPRIKGKEMPPMWDHILFSCWHNQHLDIGTLKAKQRLDSWTSGQWKQIIEQYQKQLV